MSGTSDLSVSMASLAPSVSKSVAMIYVTDVTRSLAWYTSIGFTELTRFEEDSEVNFGMVALGKAEVMFNPHGDVDRLVSVSGSTLIRLMRCISC